ncbi:MAG: NAD(+)/NADH kinase [Bacteroidales bacterium]|nr:NAD(+)/NADH kinase [Bacteroidales bacterium]
MLIAIYGSRRQTPHAPQLQTLLHALAVGGAGIAMHPKLYEHLSGELGMSLPGVTVADPYRSPAEADLALSIGGDGTFLRTAAWVAETGTPILGINTGNLGYLSALGIDEAVAHTDFILEGDYIVEPRTLLHVQADGLRGWPYALNEAVVAKEDSASMITASATVGGRALTDYRADGLIVSTPTGSTAYNLSAGGPIVQPSAPCWVITPICAHSLGMRPLVISDDMEISLKVTGRCKAFRLSLDGRSVALPQGTTVTMRRAGFRTNIVQLRCNEFPAVLRSKLMFN